MTTTESCTPPSAEAIEGLIRFAVAELKNEINELREQLAAEVRTRRIVVVDKDGREVIYSTMFEHAVQLSAEWTNSTGHDCVSSMYAGDENGGEAGFHVSNGGQIIAHLSGIIDTEPEEGQETRRAPNKGSAALDLDMYWWDPKDRAMIRGQHQRAMLDPAGLRVQSGQMSASAVLQVNSD